VTGPPARPQARRAAFRRGLRQRSPLVLAAAAALLVPALLGVQSFFVSGAWSMVPLQSWMRNSTDDYMYVSWSVAAIKRDPPTLPTAVLLGGSSGRESTADDASLAAAVRGAGGPRIAAYNLSSRMQRFAQSWAIIDNLPDAPTTVLIGVNLGRFTTSPASNYNQVVGRELLLKSDSLRAFVVRESGQHAHSYTILPGIFSALATYLKEHARDLEARGRLQAPPYRQHIFDRRRALSVAEKRALVRTWLTHYYPAFRRLMTFHVELLDALVARARERGLDVVIVELPYNRDLVGDAFDEALAMYRGPTQAIARRHGATYLDFNDKVTIPNADFRDLSHLRAAGRSLWQAQLARELARLYATGVLRGAGP